MSESVGLDIGTSAIKAVRYRRSLAGQDEVEYFYQPLPFLKPDQGDVAERARLIRRFLERHQLHRTPIVTALPCRNLSLRRLALPFTDPEKMAQVVPFEMENLIPMSIEDVAVEGLMLAPKDVTAGARPQSDVLVAAAPKKTLSEHLEFLGAARVHPAAVNVDAQEGDVRTLTGEQLGETFQGLKVRLIEESDDVAAAVRESRVGRELWKELLLLGIAVLLLETFLAHWFTRRLSTNSP